MTELAARLRASVKKSPYSDDSATPTGTFSTRCSAPSYEARFKALFRRLWRGDLDKHVRFAVDSLQVRVSRAVVVVDVERLEPIRLTRDKDDRRGRVLCR